MKLVTVVIRPFKLEDVREALSAVGIQGLTVTEVKGFGRQKGHAELYRGAEYSVNFLLKVKIDIAIADDQLDDVIDIISKAACAAESLRPAAKFVHGDSSPDARIGCCLPANVVIHRRPDALRAAIPPAVRLHRRW